MMGPIEHWQDNRWIGDERFSRMEDLREFPQRVVAHVSIFAVIRDVAWPENPARGKIVGEFHETKSSAFGKT